MKISVIFDPEDGTGRLSKECHIYDPHMLSPDGLWYTLVRAMREIIHDWQWRQAGKPPWEEKEKRLAWKIEARKWTAPINEMIAAAKEVYDAEDKAKTDPSGEDQSPKSR